MDIQLEKKSWVKKNLLYIIIGALFLILIGYQVFFTDHSSKMRVEKEKISIEEVRRDIFQDYIAVTGTVEPIITFYLDATEGGRVEEILIEEGTMVKKGEIILKLSNDNLLLEIANNEAQVAQAVNEVKTLRVNLENQQINNKNQLVDLYYDLLKLDRLYKNNQKLIKEGYISKEEMNISQENYEKNKLHYDLLKIKSQKDSVFMESRLAASEESVESMLNNLKLIRERINKLIIKAPVDGELATLNPEIGQVISYGTRIGTINILDSYKLRVEIDEHYLARIKKGLKGTCDFSGVDYLSTITKIYPEVKDGRFAVDMVFDKQIPEEIKIGQTSRINLELGESKLGILIPRGGFYQNTGGQWIFVVDKSGQFAYKRNIRIGRQNPKFYEVMEGLEPSEKVIISGYENFGENKKLILK